MPLIVRPDAEDDIRDVRTKLDRTRVGLGDRFAARLRELFLKIETRPELYGVVWQDVRAVRFKKFQFVVYYVAFPDRAEVLAVMHGARDASAWRSRL